MRRADPKYADPEYRAMKAALTPEVERGEHICTRTTDQGQPVGCNRPILPGQAWDLGHTDIGFRPQHARCNRSAGARKGNRARRQRSLNPSRDW